MNWYQTLFEMIDMRSFSNLWYWIALAVMWSSASHWVLGVPFDMVQRARRSGGQAQADLEAITHVNARRILMIRDVAGTGLVSLVFAVLTGLGLLAFWYWLEFAQAVFCLAFPMAIVGGLSLRTAARIARDNAGGDDLANRLTRHRFATQLVGVAAILFTSLFGMWQNVSVGPLGG